MSVDLESKPDIFPTLSIKPGSKIQSDGRSFTVIRLLDLHLLLCREDASGLKATIDLSTLEKPRPSGKITGAISLATDVDLEGIDKYEWEVAEHRRAAILPLLAGPEHGTARYKEIAVETGVAVSTLYRWTALYRNSGGLLTSLLDGKSAGGRGQGRLPEDVELIVSDYIKNHYLKLSKPSIASAMAEIHRRCGNAGLKTPAINTIRLRLGWITEREKVKQREGRAAAEDRFDAIEGTDPHVKWPLAKVMIDHTLLPIIIVDDIHRKPIKRAWITLAIDVFSRVCLGMYLSLDPPSAMSAGLCLSHCILPKQKWMARFELEGVEWPYYGKMGVLQLDNAKEFRGNLLKIACNEYDIDTQFRPVKTPRYGAHIERLMGTVSTGLKAVDGTTFSGPAEKGEYDSEGCAMMTLDELERWLIVFFAKYHKATIHSGIGTTPHQKWSEGLMGTKTTPARGLPPIYDDSEKVYTDFIPFDERVIHPYGVEIDNVKYFDNVLRPWIGLKDPRTKRNRFHRFRRDPRDVSYIQFYDPNLKRYFKISSGLPPVSIWELREIKAMATAGGVKKIDERVTLFYLNLLHGIQQDSAEKTKSARSAQQQQRQHAKARSRATGAPAASALPAPSKPSAPHVSKGAMTVSPAQPSGVQQATAQEEASEASSSERKIKGYDSSLVKPILED